MWQFIGLLAIGVVYAALFAPARKIYNLLERQGAARRAILWLIVVSISFVPLSIVFATISDRMRESRLADVATDVEPIAAAVARGSLGPLEGNNPGTALVSLLAGAEIERAKNIQYRPLDLLTRGAERLSSEGNLPFFVIDREIRTGEMLRFPAAAPAIDQLAVAIPDQPDAETSEITITIVGPGASRRNLVVDSDVRGLHGWGQGSERVKVEIVQVQPKAVGASAIELRTNKSARIAGFCQVENGKGTALTSEEITRSGLPVRAPASVGERGLLLANGGAYVDFEFSEPVDADRLWFIYTSTDSRALDYHWYGEDIIEFRLEYADGRVADVRTLRHGEEIHSGNLDRSRHADDLTSSVAFTWDRDGASWHADQLKVEFDGIRRIKKIRIRNISGIYGYSVELLGITAGMLLEQKGPDRELPANLNIFGQKMQLRQPLRNALDNFEFAFADRRGMVRAARGKHALQLSGASIDEPDLADVNSGRVVPARCGTLAGLDGDLTLLPVRDRDTVVGSLIIFSPEDDRAFRRGKFIFIPLLFFLFISPMLATAFAESLSRGESVRRKIAVALALGALVPAGALLLILPGSFERARFDTSARRLDAELRLMRERFMRDRENALSMAGQFFKSLREHPRVAPNFVAPARPDLESQLRREISLARTATFGERASFVRLEIKIPGGGTNSWKTIDDFDPPYSLDNVDVQGADYYKIQDSLFLVSVDRWSHDNILARLILGLRVQPTAEAGGRVRLFDLTGAPLDHQEYPAGITREIVANLAENSVRGNRSVVHNADPAAILGVFRDLDTNPAFAYAIFESGGSGQVVLFGIPVSLTLLLGSVAMFAALATLSIARILTERLARPLESLASATENVRGGNVIMPLDMDMNDEVGEIAERFHSLSADLVRRIEHLNELHKGMLTFAGRLNRADVAREASRFAANATNASTAVIMIPDPRGSGWRAYGSNGREKPAHASPLLQQLVAADHWLLFQNDGPEALGFLAGARELLDGSYAMIWAGPIRLGLRSEGFLILAFQRLADLGQRESARVAAGAIAIALENARAYGLAIEDSATQALVPHFFEMKLNESLDRARALGKRVWITRFALPESGHHDWTERIIITVAGRLRRFLERRTGALIGRMGPCELILALEDPGEDVRERIASVFHKTAARMCAKADLPGADLGHVLFPDQGPGLTSLLRSVRKEVAPTPASSTIFALAGAVEIRSEGMLDVLQRAARLLNIDIPILIYGEPDVGKEFLARQMHRMGPRPEAPFVVCPLGQLVPALAEAELFGVQAGAFSGADKTRPGIFEQANGGSLVLSELQECSADVQAKVLRAIQEKVIRRLGSNQSIPLNIRWFATSSIDLSEAVRKGNFRADLYYRIGGALLHIPPVRERRDDIINLCARFLELESPGQPRALSPQAAERLLNHTWPGNLTELRSALMRALVVVGDRTTISADDLEITKLQTLRRVSDLEDEDLKPATVLRSARPNLDRRSADVWNERQSRLLAMLAKGDRITTTDYVRLMNVSNRTGLRDLVELVRKGRLRQEGRKRGTSFKVL
ncbi:MAG: sigma 54-interacting transcriptional regulator [Planctomycetes bacterium]|nr:sigma 54-interacting transcriptional regulator [Planctomycetota bacterium]